MAGAKGDGVSGALRRCRALLVPSAVVGYSCQNAWAQVVFSDRFAGAAQAAGTTVGMVHLVGSALAVLTALVLFLAARAIAPLHGRRGAVALIGAVAVCSTAALALIAQAVLPPGGTTVLNGLVTVSSVALSLAWYERLASLGVAGALATFGAAAVLGSALYFVAMALNGVASDIVLAALPLAAVALLLASRGWGPGLPPSHEGELAASPAAPEPAARPEPSVRRTVVSLAVIVGLANYANGSYLNLALHLPSGSGVWGLLYTSVSHILTALPAVVLAALFWRSRMRVAFCISICCVLAASLLTFAWDEAPIEPLLLLVHMGVELMGFLTVAVFIDLARSRDAAATMRLFALYSLAQFSGTLVGQLSSMAFADNRPLTALLLMLVLVVMLMLAFMAHDSIAPARLGAVGEGGPASEGTGLTGLPRLADACGLSPRELEVAQLWVAGHNSAYIEETLSISKHTVRTHLKNIYAKTHTANKEDLIRLVEKDAGR